MSLTPERIRRLREFGLSEYAARAYLALLDLGTTEARDVSSLSKVPASKIYHILDQLHEKGLLVVVPEFPRKYAPVPFSDYLLRIHEQHESAARAIRAERDALEEMFAVVGGTPAGDRGGLTILRARRNVHERLVERLEGARREVLLLLTEGQCAEPRPLEEALAAAIARGVEARLLAPPACLRALGGALPAAKLRARPEGLPESACALVVDGTRAILVHRLPDDAHATEGNDTAVDVDQEGIAGLLAALLAAPWTASGGPGRAVAVVS